jgi:basic amino acid/polyamine antiporter, APA family
MLSNSEQRLIKALGPVVLTAAVVNIIVGGGIFRLPAQLSESLGAASPMAFLLGALLFIPITLCFAAAGSRVLSTGGPYSYLQSAFGDLPGFVAGSLMWICNLASSAGIANAIVELALPELGGTARMGVLIALYGLLSALNLYGVAIGGRVLLALATLKLTPLIIFVVVGLFFVDFSQISWFAIPSLAALGSSMVAVVFAYSGIETALIPSGEVRDPARDIPRAAFAATLIVVALYVGIQVVCQAQLGTALIGDKTPIANAAGTLWAPAKAILLITAALSMFGLLMGNLLGSARVAYALGRDGHLPTALGAISSKGVPHIGILAHAGIACAMAIAGDFEFLILVSGGANCLIYIGVALAAWRLQQSAWTADRQPYLMPGGALLMPAISCIALIAVLSTLGGGEWRAIGIALLLLLVIYAARRMLRQSA